MQTGDMAGDASQPVSIVAGGAGFLGSHLCDRLLAAGHRVVAVDNLVTGSLENIAHLRGRDEFGFIEQDVTEPLAVAGAARYVFDLASPASPMDYLRLPLETLKVGALGTMRCLELAEARRATFLLASTSEVYGDPLQHPQSEEYWGNVNPVGPRSVYDEAKRYAEALTMAWRGARGVDTRIARIFNTYGPRMRLDDGRVVPAFIGQSLRGEPLTVFGDGTQTRSFCYVSDLVEGLWRLAQSDVHQPVNLGNPGEFTIIEFARLVLKITGSKSEIVHKPLPQDDPKQRRPDITRAKRLLDWEPRVKLADGLRETIEYFGPRVTAGS
jgi:dTDP-glucose 4,6-dehydratase